MKRFRIKSTGKVFEAPGYMQEMGGKLYNNNTKKYEGVEGDIVIVTEFGKAKRGRLKGYTDFQLTTPTIKMVGFLGQAWPNGLLYVHKGIVLPSLYS